MVYTKLPQTLDLEESIDLQWQKDKFQLFLKTNEDNIEKSKPLVFYVNDSTGKQYTVKTKRMLRVISKNRTIDKSNKRSYN